MSDPRYEQRFDDAYEHASTQRGGPTPQTGLLGPGGLSAMAQSQELLALQMKGDGPAEAGALDTAAKGVAGPGGPLPHGDKIQAAFGRHDVSDVQAHVGGAAEQAAMMLNAQAYATGRSVAFARQPDLHTAAHEAAHVVQQRAGVHLKDGVGRAGDAYEQHADAVADAVVAGRSAEGLLDRYSSGSGGGTAVQLKEDPNAKEASAKRDLGPLTESVLIAIAQKETHQKAVESHMQTSAGVKASYPSQVQATVGWTLTALKKLSPASRKKFGVTLKDLRAAEKRARAAGDLWSTTMESGDKPIAELKKDGAIKKALTDSGLTETDLGRMVDFRDLRKAMSETADAELAEATEKKGKPLDYSERNSIYKGVGREVAKSDANKRIKMGHVSIRSHIRQDKEPKRSAMWREDMAGWQRKAVEAGPKGAEIKKAATDDSGLALGRARIGDIVKDYVGANPKATDEQVVRHAAKKHNPGSRNYQRDVVKIWRKQAKERAAAGAAAKEAAEKAKSEGGAAVDGAEK